MRKKSGIVAFCLALLMVFAMMPVSTFQAYAATTGGITTGPVKDGALDGLKVRIRPTGSFKPLSINQDGSGSQNCVHLYYQGKSSQFYLQRAVGDYYYINFYQHYYDETPKTTGDCRLDLEDDGGYDKEGQIIHVVSGNSTADNKQWQFIRQADGSYYIRNKKTQKYWTLQDLDKDPSKKFKDKTKLVQSSTPLKWDIEIVSKNNTQFQNKVQYDSRNFEYNGQTVRSNNWMSALPDDLKITDISIPGTHDSGSCHLHEDQGGLSTQRYYIDEMLNAGVRHLDIRTGLNGNTVRIIHSNAHARNHQENDLTLEETMDWIIAFLNANPEETVIIQPKMDKEGGKCDYLTYSILRDYAVGNGQYIWAGDHVPTLGEVRGKILVLSRLNTDNDYNDFDYNIATDVPGKYYQWALDLDHWNASGGAESEDRAAAHTASGVDYDVWVQDNYKHKPDDKKDYIQKTLYGNKGDGYTNGTQYHYDQSKMNSKDAWILNYTSASHKSDIDWENYTPFELSKEIQQWMLDRSDDYNRLSERIISSDTFTGIMAFDYMDGLLSTFIYKTNFKRDYVPVKGVDVDGKEVAGPLILQIGENDQPNKILSARTKRILEGQFNNVKYELIPSDDGDYLTMYKDKLTAQEALDNIASEFRNKATEGDFPETAYVHLRTSITEVGLDVTMPKCGTNVSGGDPQVSVDFGSTMGCKAQSAYITQDADSEEAFVGPVEGGKTVPIQIKLAPEWGYRFDNSCTVKSGTANIESTGVSDGVITVKAKASIPHDAEAKEEKDPTCTENGVKAHYQCKSCNKYLLEKKATGSDKAVLVEVEEDEIITKPALGHQWGEWAETTPATESDEGLETRICANCSEAESRAIPKLDHKHSMTHVEEKAATCSSEGNIAHYECSGCGRCFEDEEGSRELMSEDIVIPQTQHDWETPAQFTPSRIGDTYYMTATMNCRNDASHVITETVPAVAIVTPATCEKEGSIDWEGTFTNQSFGTHHMFTPVPALNHNWSDWVVTKKATCSEKGSKIQTCSRCDKTNTEEIPIDKDAHDTFIELDESTNTASCEEAGRANQYEVCSICGTVIKTKRANTSPAGHNWGETVYKWSEDMSEATATRTCSRRGCGKEESETVKTTNRIMEKAGCETAGKVKYDAQFESEAFDTQEKVVEVKAIGHDWGEWEVTKAATETEEGVEIRTCKYNPEHTQTRAIPVLAHTHNLKEIPAKAATCTEDGSNAYWVCNQGENPCGRYFGDAEGKKEIKEDSWIITAKGHDWGEWLVTKEPTETEAGEKQRVCNNDPSHIEQEMISANGSDPNQKGIDGTAVGLGASAASADKAITGMPSDRDPKGSVYNKLKLRSTRQTNTMIKLRWTRMSEASKFVLYGNKCGAKNKMKKLGTYTGNSKKLTKVVGKKIKKGTYYKFILVALDKNNNVVSTSKLIHVATKGGKVTNPNKVTVTKEKKSITKAAVKQGKTFKVKNTVTKAVEKLKLKTHRKVIYESSNTEIATVTTKGNVKGIMKGTCYIYAYAQNGVYKKIKVTVN